MQTDTAAALRWIEECEGRAESAAGDGDGRGSQQ